MRDSVSFRNSASATGLPFYGYSTAGQFDAWTYFDGVANQWKLWSGDVRMTVDRATGRVGVGINPQAKLHIGGTPGVDGIMFPDGMLQATAGGGGGGNTLDQAYDQGGPGAGRLITADSGSIRINGDGLLLDGPHGSSDHALNIYAITDGDTIHTHNDDAGRGGYFFARENTIESITLVGRAGQFTIENRIHNQAAVYAETRGTGVAGQFVFNNFETAGSGVLATSNGSSGSSALLMTTQV